MSRRRPGAASPRTQRRRQRRDAPRAATGVDGGTTVRPRRRRRGLRVTLVVILGLVTLMVGTDWALHTSFLRVRHVVVTGLRHESRSAVLAASGLIGTALIDVNGATVASRLSVFPWIDAVTVTKHWPNTVDVRVLERRPVAVAFDGNHTLQFVDASGHDLGPAPLSTNLPTLQYVDPRSRSWPFAHAGFNAALVASRLPAAFAAQVAVITVDDHGSVSLKMTTPVTFILGTPTDLTDKFVSVASVIAHSQLRPGDVVDVRSPGELAVTGPSSG